MVVPVFFKISEPPIHCVSTVGGTRSDIDVLHISFQKFHMLLVTCVAAKQKQHGPPASGIHSPEYF